MSEEPCGCGNAHADNAENAGAAGTEETLPEIVPVPPELRQGRRDEGVPLPDELLENRLTLPEEEPEE